MANIKETLKLLLNRIFSLREGEYRSALLMQLNIFLLISTLLIVKPAVNALFLSRFGAERLPGAFILVALTALVVSYLYARLLAKKPLNLIIERTLVISFATLIFFVVMMQLNVLDDIVLYLFYIWVAIFAVLSSSQFWILANLVYNVREAKRLFSFIGAGAIAGGIFGGYLTNLLAPFLGTENLLFVSAMFLLMCIPVTRLIWKDNVSSLSLYNRRKRIRGFGDNPLRTVLSSRHLSYLAGIIGVSVIVAKLVDFQFSDVAHRAIADPDELAAFFGFWFSSINLISLAIQLFLTSRLVGVWGVGTSLLFLPAGIIIGASLLFIFPELWAAVFIKAADGSLKQSINKSATELLGLPISIEIKKKTKIFIDVVVDSAATGIAGIILIFIVRGMDLSTRAVSTAIILLIAGWIYLIIKVRKEYVKSFKMKIQGVAGEVRTENTSVSPKSVVEGIENVLVDGSEEQIHYILEKIREMNTDQLYSRVTPLLSHASGSVRADTIQTLYFYHSSPMVEEIKPFIYDPNFKVKLAAFEYLFDHDAGSATDLLETHLDNSNQDIADAALLSLAIETQNNKTLKDRYNLKNRILARIEKIDANPDPETRKSEKLLISELLGFAKIESLNYYLLQLLSDSDTDVKRKAIQSVAHTFDPLFINTLANFLGNKDLKVSAQVSLASYGVPIVSDLMNKINQRTAPIESLRNIPGVLERIDSQLAVNGLFELLDDPDYLIRQKATRSLNKAKLKYPHLNFYKKQVAQRILEEGKLYLNTLCVMHAQIIKAYKKGDYSREPEMEDLHLKRRYLIELLEKRLDSDLQRIFGLLGLKYPPEDIHNAYEGIRSNKPEQRINAIEYLDNLLEPDLKRLLIPIVETTVLDDISEETLRSLSLDIPSEMECFEMLLAVKDRHIKIAVLNLIELLDDKKYIPVVRELTKNDDDVVQEFAENVFSKLSD